MEECLRCGAGAFQHRLGQPELALDRHRQGAAQDRFYQRTSGGLNSNEIARATRTPPS